MKYPCLNKEETEIKFLLMLGINKQPYKINILFKKNNNYTTPTDTAINFAFESKCNVTSASFNLLIFQNPCNVLQL